MKKKGVCEGCGLVSVINTFGMCRMCQSIKNGSYWSPEEKWRFKQRMIWRYRENRLDMLMEKRIKHGRNTQ